MKRVAPAIKSNPALAALYVGLCLAVQSPEGSRPVTLSMDEVNAFIAKQEEGNDELDTTTA